MIPATYVLWASLLVTDAGGKHPVKPIAREGAEEIAAYCSDHPIHYYLAVPGDEFCACLLTLHSFRESGWFLTAVGDGGKSRGPFQDQTLPKGRVPTWKEAMASFGKLLHRAEVCETPLEMLAQGKCGPGVGRDLVLVRLSEARKMVLAMRFYDYPGR